MAAPIQSIQVPDFATGAKVYGIELFPGRELTGRRFFVDSTSPNKGDDSQHGTSVFTPFATIGYAVSQALAGANRGDVVYALPGHTETLTTAGGISMNIAGLHLVCLGAGRDRPKVTLSGSTGASIDITAANCVIENMVVDMTGIDSIGQGGSANGGIRVQAADFMLVGCELIIATGSAQVKNAVGLTTAAQRCKLLYNLLAGTATAGPNSAIELYGAGGLTVEGLEIGWNRIVGDFATEAISINMTDVLLNAYIHHNKVTATGAAQQCLAVTIGAGSSGIVEDNVFLGTDVSIVYSDTDIGLANVNNKGYDIDTDGLLGVDVPIVGTTLPEETSLLDQILGEFSVLHANHLLVTANFSSATWNTVGTHEVVHVVGRVRVIIIPICVTDLTSGGAATLALGDDTPTAASLIAATLATTIDADEFWLTATPSKLMTRANVLDLIVGELDLGYTIAVAAMTGGRIDFHVWWVPLDATTGTVTAGDGSAL